MYVVHIFLWNVGGTSANDHHHTKYVQKKSNTGGLRGNHSIDILLLAFSLIATFRNGIVGVIVDADE